MNVRKGFTMRFADWLRNDWRTSTDRRTQRAFRSQVEVCEGRGLLTPIVAALPVVAHIATISFSAATNSVSAKFAAVGVEHSVADRASAMVSVSTGLDATPGDDTCAANNNAPAGTGGGASTLDPAIRAPVIPIGPLLGGPSWG
jgi:hypothetical protein